MSAFTNHYSKNNIQCPYSARTSFRDIHHSHKYLLNIRPRSDVYQLLCKSATFPVNFSSCATVALGTLEIEFLRDKLHVDIDMKRLEIK